MNWYSLLMTVAPRRDEIRIAVRDENWQRVRRGMLGMTQEEKYERLVSYLKEGGGRMRKVRVHNYVNALKRGGLI